MGFSRQEYWSGLPFPSAGESSWPRDRTWVSCIGSWILCGLSDQGSSRQNKWGKRLLQISTDGQILAFFLLSTLSYIWKETFIFWWFYRVTWPLNCRPSSNTLGSHNTSHPQNCFHPPLNLHHHSMLHISHWTCPIFFSCIFCASFFCQDQKSLVVPYSNLYLNSTWIYKKKKKNGLRMNK